MGKYNSNVLHAIPFMTIMLCFMMIMLYSCDNKSVDPKKFNEIIAQIVEVTPGHTLNLKATGTNAKMGCDIYSISTFISGTDVDNANATIDISVTQCVTSEGTYSIQGFYDRSKRNNAFEPDFASKRNGSITFTKLDGNHLEGHFEVVLYCTILDNDCNEKDSVIVNGSFKGDQI
jgi:hypothetical protein